MTAEAFRRALGAVLGLLVLANAASRPARAETLDLSDYTQTFSDEFKTLDIGLGPGHALDRPHALAWRLR